METDVIEEVRKNGTDDPDDDHLEHYYCPCAPNVAVCGADLTDARDNTDVDTPLEDDCVVCIGLLDIKCPFCGLTDTERESLGLS